MTRTFLFTDIEGSTRQWEESPGDARSGGAHFDVLRDGGRARSGVRCSRRWVTASRRRSRQPTPPCRPRSRPSVTCRRSASRCGWASTPARWSGSATTSEVAPSIAPRASWPSGHGGQILVSDVSAALVRSGPSPVEFVDLGTHRLRDLTEPERVWQVVHPDLPQALPSRAWPRHLRQQPAAQRSTLIGRDRRRGPRHRPDPASTGSSPSPAWVGSARRGSPYRPRPTCCREHRRRVVRRAGQRGRSRRRRRRDRPHHGARRRDRSAGGGRGDAGRRATCCWSSTTASTSSTAPRP